MYLKGAHDILEEAGHDKIEVRMTKLIALSYLHVIDQSHH